MSSHSESFDPLESTVADVHAAMDAGDLTAEGLLDRYLDRVDAYDDELNAVLTVNDDARGRARSLDERLETEGFVGPLHGVPVLVKDNTDVEGLATTAGSVPMADSMPGRDATIVANLRAAGAVVLGKTNLQELSFGVDTISSLGGPTRNPYDRDRRPSGSSGGTAAAVAANLGLVGTGTDTCSSVRSPPAFNCLVGVRPTRGLASRTGIVPLSDTQDVPGPIARTVDDAARVLDAMVGFDPEDPVTARGVGRVPDAGYAGHVDPAGLSGARIGVVREAFAPRDDDRAAAAREVTAVVDDAVEAMDAAGATVVDPVEAVDRAKLLEARVLRYEFRRDFEAYLDEIDAPAVDSLSAVVESGEMAPSVERRVRDSGALAVDPDAVADDPEYNRRLALRERLRERVLATLADDALDAVVYPPSTVPPVEIPDNQPFPEMRCELSAHTGLPAVVVPAGFTDDGLPVGVEFLGSAFEEGRLLELAAGFEAATDHRRPPAGFGPL
ncbi:MAG: amidase [Halolamina sp.]